jgi:hypothetical protein
MLSPKVWHLLEYIMDREFLWNNILNGNQKIQAYDQSLKSAHLIRNQ